MEKKLHIKAVAGRNIKVDAYWYKYGDKIDCYLTPAQFKDYVNGFLDFDILLDDDSSQKSIEAEFKLVEDKTKQEEEVVNNELQKPNSNEKLNTRKNTKKTS